MGIKPTLARFFRKFLLEKSTHNPRKELFSVYLGEQLGSGMHRIMQYYKPEDFAIDDNFVTACFKYNEHALNVMNGQESTEKVRSKCGESTEKVRRKYGESTEKKHVLSATQKRIIALISADSTMTTDAVAAAIGVSISAIQKNIRQLKDAGFIARNGGDKGGHWEIIK